MANKHKQVRLTDKKVTYDKKALEVAVLTKKGRMTVGEIYEEICSMPYKDFGMLFVEYAEKNLEAPYYGTAVEEILRRDYITKPDDENMKNSFMRNVYGPIMRKLFFDYAYDIEKGAEKIMAYKNALLIIMALNITAVDENGVERHILEEGMATSDIRQSFGEALSNYPPEYVRGKIEQGIIDAITNETHPKSYEAQDRLIDWYFDDIGVVRDREMSLWIVCSIEDLAKKDKEGEEVALAFYENHTKQMNEMFKMHPEHDFVTRGESKRYDSIDGLAKAMGVILKPNVKQADFFTEPSEKDTITPQSTAKERRETNRAEREAYTIAVLTAISELHYKVMDLGYEEPQIFNVKPNEIKKKTSTYGKYVAVAFRTDGKWYILVDCIYKNNAVYVWHGDELATGLKAFEQSKTYAQERPGVKRKNHSQLVTLEKTYAAAFEKVGLAI